MTLRSILVMVLLLMGLILVGAKSIPIGSDHGLVATIVQKTAVPGYQGNNKYLICDLDGQSIRIQFDWNENTKIDGKIRVVRLNKFLFPPSYVLDFNQRPDQSAN